MNTRNGTTGSTVGSNLDQKIDSIKSRARGLVDQGHEKVGAFKTRVVEARDQAMNRGKGLVDSTCDVIKQHPLKSVGIAFGIGYLGMRLFRR
ncbi:MAG: DUF883 family protein [Kofleriaceae bacterium]